MAGPMTIATAVERIARLTPTYRSPILKGDGVGVLTPAHELPEEFRAAQEERTAHYSTSTDRTTARRKPDHAPAYIVTSYGVPIAWVTLDGRTHYATDGDLVTGMYGLAQRGLPNNDRRYVAVRRHREMVREVWPDRMGHDAMGEPSIRVPAGMREDDSTGFVRHVPA